MSSLNKVRSTILGIALSVVCCSTSGAQETDVDHEPMGTNETHRIGDTDFTAGRSDMFDPGGRACYEPRGGSARVCVEAPDPREDFGGGVTFGFRW